MRSVIVRHTSGFDFTQGTRRVLLSDPEFFLGLAINNRRPALFYSDLIAPLERGAKILGLGYVFTVRAKSFTDFVVSEVFLE